MQHKFFYAKSLVFSRFNYKKISFFVVFERVCALWAEAERRVYNAG